MQLLFISPMYYPHIGGVEYIVRSVAERLAELGHEITVLAGEPKSKKPIEEEINKVNVIRWPTWSPNKAYHIPKFRKMLEKRLEEIVKEVRVVHIHSIHTVLSVWVGQKLEKLGFKGKVVVTPHYHGTGHTVLRKMLWIPWRHSVRSLLKRARIHAVSSYEAELLEKHFNVKSIVIEHGVDEDVLRFKWKPQDYIMYSGRIERYKNIDRVARITSILNEKYNYNLKLKIYGNGSYKRKLVQVLDALGLEYEINDFQPYNKYLETLSNAKLFALLSEKEAFGQTVNEANAIGVPVVIAKPWGENFKDRSRTLIVSLSESDSKIAERISRFLTEAPRQPISKVSTWREVVEKYLALYIS